MLIAMSQSDAGSAHGSLIAGLFNGVRYGMMPQIAGYIHVDSGRTHLIEQGITGTRKHRHRADRNVQIAANLHAKLGVRQRASYSTGEITQRHRFGKTPHTPQTDRMLGIRIIDGHQRTLIHQTEHVSRSHADATIRRIGIRMPHPQRTSGKIELTHNLTTETQSRHRMNGTEEQRMMANQQINTTGNRLINHRHRGISRKSDTAHRLTQITHDKTRLIPLLRIAKRIQRFQHIHNLLQRCHHSSLCHCSTTHIRNTHETQYRISARQAANPNQYPWKHPTEPPYRPHAPWHPSPTQ